jgi:hypothetical protein
MEPNLVAAIAAFPERIVTAFRWMEIAGCVVIALYAFWHGLKYFRVSSLADKARKAEQMRRETLRATMQPRYTPSELRAALRTHNERWS